MLQKLKKGKPVKAPRVHPLKVKEVGRARANQINKEVIQNGL